VEFFSADVGGEETGKLFAIGADQDAAVKAAIATIAPGEWKTFRDGEIARCRAMLPPFG
jgi:hypothetical protein